MRTLIVAGSRNFNDYERMCKELDKLCLTLECEIVTGGARGADSLAMRYAEEKGIPCKVFPAEWDAYGKAAGPIRNKAMAAYAKERDGFLLAFSDGGKGTEGMIKEASRAGIESTVIDIRIQDTVETKSIDW